MMLMTMGVLLMLCVGTCGAQEVTAESPSIADIQAAVDSLAGPGTVHVPAGEAEAIGTLRLRPGIRLIGAGAESTKLFRGDQTEINAGGSMIAVTGGSDPTETLTQVAGLNLVGVTDPTSAGWDMGIAVQDLTGFRIDHCRFEAFGSAAVSVRGVASGVVDHCLFEDNFKPAINNMGYGVVVYGPGYWSDDLVPGGPGAVFIEDSEFIGSRHAVASNNGAWYVFRHNHVHDHATSHAIDAHGHGYGSQVGTQFVEVYANVVEAPRAGSTAMVFRGGGGVVFDNAMRDYSQGIGLTLDGDPKIDWSAPYPIDWQIHDFWLWDNTLGGEPVQPFINDRSANYIKLDRDYHVGPRPGYEPFVYPHPLACGGPFDEVEG